LGSEDVLFYIDVKEKSDYANYLDKSMMRTHPSLYGVGAIRQFLLKENMNEDYVVMWDDDVTHISYKCKDIDEQKALGVPLIDIIREPDHIREVIDNLYQCAVDLKTPLFGMAATVNPAFYNYLQSFRFNGMITFCTGLIPRLLGAVDYDPRFIIKSDHDICLQTKFFHRFYLIDTRYDVAAKDIWVGKGGCSTLRNETLYPRILSLLKRKYGNHVIHKGKKPHQISINPGF
tara:strand:+ start:1558 stop:2253 length:696 start_codon:yes stop_codon:yes gene_type:complete